MCLGESDQLVKGLKAMSPRKDWGLGAVRLGEEETQGRRWRKMEMEGLPVCDLGAVTDEEMIDGRNSIISISADVCGGIWMASGKEVWWITGWIGCPMVALHGP